MQAATELDMQILIEFLSLRPVFTRKALHGIWYAYLLATLVHLGQFVPFVYSTRANYPAGLSPIYYLGLISPVLFALANLVLVRIFLEIALHFVEKRSLSA
jgi:hypothetical protein